MKNKKKTKPSTSQEESEAQNQGPPLGDQPSVASEGPTTTIKTWLSIWVAVHLIAIVVSFTAVVEPSSLHQRLADVLQPYLRPSHFSADDRPVYLTYGDADDQPHRIEVTTERVTGVAGSDNLKWRVIGPAEAGGFSSIPGLAVSDRVARWLSTVAMLAENDQPSLVADLLLPVVAKQISIQGVRIVRYPTDLNDVSEGVSVPYLARVVRDNDAVSLIQLKESRLSAQPRLSAFHPDRTHGSPQVPWPDKLIDLSTDPLAAFHEASNHLSASEAMQ